MSDADDHRGLLQILEAHGKQFLNSFEQPSKPSNSKRKLEDSDGFSDSGEEGEEWNGFGTGGVDSGDSEGENSINSVYEYSEEELPDEGTTPVGGPSVVTFQDPSKKPGTSASDRVLKKAFMSSKISKLRKESSNPSEGPKHSEDADLDLSNRQNDALLHKLVHTQLLSGVANPDELNLTGAQRRKALEGRVLELAEKTKTGKGESSVRKAERNKAARRVRLGIEAKQKAVKKQKLEEAKDLGNYHPTLKRIFEDDSESRPSRRDRGLKMGVGKYKDGVLKLNRNEIRSVTGRSSSSRIKGKGRGASRKHNR
ncbi:hypothetical protein BJ322DRAFT_1205904 [Thelephora terrestris]|uniref:Uncharacterized protein n=1 Tax=Thelephora terrestris TaxID=56493 RepID=A0A9P6H618_9AGAM|nr:hypothetical protein BJ322DRAFT_1205904 [Thelephora terrestris]